MKKLVFGLFSILILTICCKTTGTMATIEPKSGTIGLPTKGELRMWKGIIHPSFSVQLTNPSRSQSCEIYKVSDSGDEKWVSPSLLAGTTITLTVPSNGHLFFKNFNGNILNIKYEVIE